MFPKTHLTIAAAATVVVTAAILMSPSADVEAKRMSYALDLEQGTVSDNGQPAKAASDRPQQAPQATPDAEPAAPAAPQQAKIEEPAAPAAP